MDAYQGEEAFQEASSAYQACLASCVEEEQLLAEMSIHEDAFLIRYVKREKKSNTRKTDTNYERQTHCFDEDYLSK